MRNKTKKRSFVLAVVVVLLAVIFCVTNPNFFYGIDAAGTKTLMRPVAPLCLILTAALVVLLLIQKETSRKTGWFLSVAALFIWPFLDFLISETAMNTGCEIRSMRIYRIVMNVWFYYLMEGIILAITLDIRNAVEGGAIFMGIFSAANIYLMEFRQIPLYMTDFVDLKTAGDVAGNYRLNLTPHILLLILFVLFTFAAVHCIWPGKRLYIQKRRGLLRVTGLILASLLIGWTTWYMAFSKLPQRHGVGLSSFRPIKSYKNNGGILTFFRSGCMLVVTKPDGYGPESVQALNKKYVSDKVDQEKKTPNVIVIMDEAFADLQKVGNFETNEDVLPFVHSLKENTVKGDLYVSVFGGHTANTEYEFLTGDSYALCPSGTPYMLYVRDQMPTLTTYMEQRGSQGNIAIHPFTASNYNREKVYRYFGFDQFLSFPDFQGVSLVRDFVSDQADFERIIAEYQKAKASSNAPFYLFNVTMQNHSPYNTDFDNLPETIRITSDHVEDKDQAERYLNLIHLSDEAAKNLVGYFKGIDDPTIIVMFGDHEPGLSGAFYESILPKKRSQMSDKEEMDLYHTPFFIWANYDIPEEEDVKISANYLQTKVKEIAGLDLTGYDKFLKQLHEQIPVICKSGYLDNKGGYYKVKDKTSPYWPQINEYWTLTYNHLFGRNGRASLFELAE